MSNKNFTSVNSAFGYLLINNTQGELYFTRNQVHGANPRVAREGWL